MKKIAHLFLLFILIFIAQSGFAKRLSLTAPDLKWEYFQTDEMDINPAQLKDLIWKPAEVPAIFIKDPTDGLYLWYKTEFNSNENELKEYPQEPLSLFIESIRNSDETWLNGTKIGHTGDISPAWDVWQQYPLNIPRVYSIPDGLLKPSNNILLVKINTGIGNIKGTEYFGSVGITGDVSIQTEISAKQSQYEINLKGNTIDVMIIVLGIIDVFLIIFLFKNTLHYIPEFPWLLLNSILMIAATLMLDVYFLFGIKDPIFGFIRYITVFAIPFVTAVYFWSQNRCISKRIVYAFGLLQLIVALIVLTPWFSSALKAVAWKTTLLLVIIFFLYALYNAIRNVQSKKIGSRAQLIGLLLYLFSVRTDIFNVELFDHRNVYIGALIFRYALLLAYFQRIFDMSGSYKSLSNRMLGTIEENRSEMARELHDGLGQHLASSKFHAQLALLDNNELGNKKDAKEVDKNKHTSILLDEINSAVHSMHRLVEGLHPVTLDRYNFPKAIKLEAKRFSSIYPIKFSLKIDKQKLPKEIELHLFRIFQEAVSNVHQHSNADQITVRLKFLGNRLIFTIIDNGTKRKTKQDDGHTRKEGGFGLISLQERVHLINGSFKRQSLDGEGTKVVLEIPL